MQPVSEFSEQLFRAAGCPPERIQFFSCGHVVAAHQLLMLALRRGVAGEALNFTFSRRNRRELVLDCGRSLTALAKIVPSGCPSRPGK